MQHPNHNRNPRKSLKTMTHICDPKKRDEVRKRQKKQNE
jgi:hypothetical protein